MAKHVYLSRRSAVLAKTFLKMDEHTRRERKKTQRRERVARKRQDLIITEYIQFKHYNIYKEALEFYNSINEKNPDKYDLRKTMEFRMFKVDTQPKIEKAYPSAEKTTPDFPQSPTEKTTPDFPQPPVEAYPSAEKTTPDFPQSPTEKTTPDFPQPPVVRRLKAANTTYNDTMKLEIPLLPSLPKTPIHTSEVMDMSLQTITDNCIQEEEMLHPSLMDELEPDLIRKILDDLREEPYLKDIFTDIEQQVEYELAMDIDLEEDIRLEKELELL